MGFFALFWGFGPFEPHFARSGIPAEGGFTSTPRGGALHPEIWGSGGLVPGKAREAQKGPILEKTPKMGVSGSGAPEGVSQHPARGQGPGARG